MQIEEQNERDEEIKAATEKLNKDQLDDYKEYTL